VARLREGDARPPAAPQGIGYPPHPLTADLNVRPNVRTECERSGFNASVPAFATFPSLFIPSSAFLPDATARISGLVSLLHHLGLWPQQFRLAGQRDSRVQGGAGRKL
jgi:hypothetical protein